jgi:hypothetical protein
MTPQKAGGKYLEMLDMGDANWLVPFCAFMTIPTLKMKHGFLCYHFGLLTDFMNWQCNSTIGFRVHTYQYVPNLWTFNYLLILSIAHV